MKHIAAAVIVLALLPLLFRLIGQAPAAASGTVFTVSRYGFPGLDGGAPGLEHGCFLCHCRADRAFVAAAAASSCSGGSPCQVGVPARPSVCKGARHGAGVPVYWRPPCSGNRKGRIGRGERAGQKPALSFYVLTASAAGSLRSTVTMVSL